VRGAGSPLTAIRVDGLEPCSIVDAGVTRFLRRLRRTQTRTLGFTRTRDLCGIRGQGPCRRCRRCASSCRGAGWSAGRSCRWRSSACSPWRCWLALRRTGPGAGSPEFPWPGLSPRRSWPGPRADAAGPGSRGRLAVGGGVAARRVRDRPGATARAAPGSGPAVPGGGAPARAERAAHGGRLAGRAGAPTGHRAAVGRTRRRVRAAAGVPRGGDGGWPRGGQVLRRNCAVCGRSAPGRTRRV